MATNVPPDSRENFGETLCRLRRRQRLSMAALAEASGISRQHIWRMEKGLVPSPGKAVLERLALSLAVSVSSLVPAAGGRDRILNVLLQHASQIHDDDFKFMEEAAQEIMNGKNGSAGQSAVQQARLRRTSRSPRLSSPQGGEAKIPDDIKIIAQFLARRDGSEAAWRQYTREAFNLRSELKSRRSDRVELNKDSGS